MAFPAVSPPPTAPCASRLLQQAGCSSLIPLRDAHHGNEFFLSKNRKAVYWILVHYEEDEQNRTLLIDSKHVHSTRNNIDSTRQDDHHGQERDRAFDHHQHFGATRKRQGVG